MSTQRNSFAEDADWLCLEARRLRALHQDLQRDRLRLLNEFRSLCATAQERVAQAQHRQAVREDQERKAASRAA
ncbi:MAG: hypothetical protein FJX25_02210 [Alphaproteobacteria bacterium]|nr:hypothetical protein [Alphaproteobacteria bacterium]